MPNLVVGCGYLGERVARQWIKAGEEVFATTRHADKAQRLAKEGIRPIVCDPTQKETLSKLPLASLPLSKLPEVETVLIAVGFDRSVGQSIHQVYVTGLSNILHTLPSTVRRIISISSTGVFGQEEGEWVDEASPCNPTREGGRACLDAERLLQDHPLGSRAVILRLAGLYGPGRLPHREALLTGKPLAVAKEGWLNLIHIDDAVQVVLAAETLATTPELLVVSDGHPVERGEYYREAARLLGGVEPQFESVENDSHVAGRARSDKRINNAHLLRQLPITWKFPSYREGLAEIIQHEDQTRENL